MSGIADVAKRAGVSKATASRALSGSGYVSSSTKDRVLQAARELGYVPSTSAVSLATGRTNNIGVIMPYTNRWFFAEVLEGIQAALLERGLDLTLYNAEPGTEGRRRIFEDFLARKRFDGLIAVGLEPEDHEIEKLIAIGRPIVGVVSAGPDAGVVALDERDAARRATEHLLALDHRSIAFVGGGGNHFVSVDRARLDGYRAAMADADLAHEIRHVTSEDSLPGGYAAAVDILADSRTRPTAIVASCDEVAAGTIIASRRLGIHVPAHLSVVGIDDHEYAEMFSLTTLRQVPREQGARAVEMIMKQITEPGLEPERVLLHARMVMRSSTSALDPSRAASAAARVSGSH